MDAKLEELQELLRPLPELIENGEADELFRDLDE